MNRCYECESWDKGKCSMSGTLGIDPEEVNANDPACIEFEERKFVTVTLHNRGYVKNELSFDNEG